MKRSWDTPFSRQMHVWMAQANVKADDIAKVVGVKVQTVYRWMSGVNSPDPEWWDGIAQALRIDRAEIAKLLLGVELLPPDVQALAEELARLPIERRLQVVRELDRWLDGNRQHSEHKLVCAPVVAAS